MLVLADRGFDGNAFLARVHATGAAPQNRQTELPYPKRLAHNWMPNAPNTALIASITGTPTSPTRAAIPAIRRKACFIDLMSA